MSIKAWERMKVIMVGRESVSDALDAVIDEMMGEIVTVPTEARMEREKTREEYLRLIGEGKTSGEAAKIMGKSPAWGTWAKNKWGGK